jgi:hypothetical protein
MAKSLTGGKIGRQAVFALLLLFVIVPVQTAQYSFALACESSVAAQEPRVPPEAAHGNALERHCAAMEEPAADFDDSQTYSCSKHFCCALPSFASPAFRVDAGLTRHFEFVGISNTEIPAAAPQESPFRPPRV